MTETVQLEGNERIVGKVVYAKSGRLALACAEEGCGWRIFPASVEQAAMRCPKHPRKTGVQRNRPYLGLEVETPEVPGLKVI